MKTTTTATTTTMVMIDKKLKKETFHEYAGGKLPVKRGKIFARVIGCGAPEHCCWISDNKPLPKDGHVQIDYKGTGKYIHVVVKQLLDPEGVIDYLSAYPDDLAILEVESGSMPDGHVGDHRCKDKRCCNPKHVKWMTAKDHNDQHRDELTAAAKKALTRDLTGFELKFKTLAIERLAIGLKIPSIKEMESWNMTLSDQRRRPQWKREIGIKVPYAGERKKNPDKKKTKYVDLKVAKVAAARREAKAALVGGAVC